MSKRSKVNPTAFMSFGGALELSKSPRNIILQEGEFEEQHSAAKSYYIKREKSIDFIKQNFTRKECLKFIPRKDLKRKPDDPIKCYCGELMDRHSKKAEIKDIYKKIVHGKSFPEEVKIEEWNPAVCIKEQPTNAFGKIEFLNEGLGGRKPSKYVRLADTTDVDLVLELMENHWNMMEPKRPNLVITVIGGAKNFKLDGKKKVIFNRGLVNAAQTTHAWLITSGCNMGVMKAVGEAVREAQTYVWDERTHSMTHSIRCIGIAPWGYVENRENLIKDDGVRSALYKASNIIKHNHPVSLNPDHTHFLLVDDGNRGRYGGVAELRARLERKLMMSSKPNDNGDTGLDIPVVLVVLEGGYDAIQDVRKSLQEKIPVVICEGTGRAADIIAYAHYITTRKGENEYKEQHKYILKSKLRNAFGKTWQQKGDVEKEVEKFFKIVIECCKDENLITVFDMNKDEDLDRLILSALLKGQGATHVNLTSSREHQLELALTWNRSDVAEEKILTDNIVWDIEFLHNIMTTALLDNKVDFVRLLLKNGVVMREYLTISRLRTLYHAVPRSHGQELIMQQRKYVSLKDVDRLLMKLINTSLHSNYQLDDGTLSPEDESIVTFPHPFRELFVWSVLVNRQELARFFWERSDESIATAITACGIYHALTNKVSHFDSDLRNVYETHKKEFEDLAVTLLEECHRTDPEKAQSLIKCRYSMWGGNSCLTMAANADCKAFLSTVCCQNVLNQMWKRGITSNWPKQILGLLIPPTILCGVKFKEELSVGKKIQTFYNAPSTKFMSFVTMYILYLFFYSYVVLFGFEPRIQIPEMVLIAWMATWCLELLRSILTGSNAPKLANRIIEWWKFSIFNPLDLIASTLCIIGVTMRFCPIHYLTTKKMYVVTLIVFYIRLLRDYSASSYLGPKIVMIYKMFKQLVLYIMILLIFLVAYGVSTVALRYPDHSNFHTIFKDIFYYPYWQIYGEVYLEELEGRTDECQVENTTGVFMSDGAPCPVYNWLVPAITACYLLIVNILLLNLLIAIFNNVFEEVEVNSIQHWKHGMYFLVVEYVNKPSLAPPFIVFEHVYILMKFLFSKRCCLKKIDEVGKSGSHERELMGIFEKESLKIIVRRQQNEHKISMDTYLYKILHKVDEMAKLMEADRYLDYRTLASTQKNLDNKLKNLSETSQSVKPRKFTRWPSLDRLRQLKEEQWSTIPERPESGLESCQSRGISPETTANEWALHSGKREKDEDLWAVNTGKRSKDEPDTNLDSSLETKNTLNSSLYNTNKSSKSAGRKKSQETNEGQVLPARGLEKKRKKKKKRTKKVSTSEDDGSSDQEELYDKLRRRLGKQDRYRSLEEESSSEGETPIKQTRSAASKKKVYAEVKELNISKEEPTDSSLEVRLARLEQITERSLYNIEALLRGAVFQRGPPPLTPVSTTTEPPTFMRPPMAFQGQRSAEVRPSAFASSSGIPYYTDYNNFQ